MRYGCVSPTPEMENVDHSDSESSDASFEIVSAEGLNDSLSATSSFKPCIKFHDIFDVYPMDADIVARVSTSDDFKISPDDKVVVVPLAWTSVDQAVCSMKLTGFHVRFGVNELPKTPPDQFYQLCYCTVEGSIVGVSTPFFFREVHEEDLMEFQKEQNKEFWTFRSRFAVLTDLYWNAVKKNVESTSSDIVTNNSDINKDAAVTENCGASKDNIATEDRDANSDSAVSEKLSTEDCNTNKDSDTSLKSSTEIDTNEKNEDPVQSQAAGVEVSNQEPTIVNEEVSDGSEHEPKVSENLEQPKVSESSEQPPNDNKLSVVAESVDVSPLNINASKNSKPSTVTERSVTPKNHTNKSSSQVTSVSAQQNMLINEVYMWNLNEMRRKQNASLVDLADFVTLPEATIGRLILKAMRHMPSNFLEGDAFLCEARRMYQDEVICGYGEKRKITATRQTKKSPAQTQVCLSSRIDESHIKMMEDLKRQLSNESKRINELQVEYLAYKKEMENRLKTCAKEYAKMYIKLNSSKRDR